MPGISRVANSSSGAGKVSAGGGCAAMEFRASGAVGAEEGADGAAPVFGEGASELGGGVCEVAHPASERSEGPAPRIAKEATK